MATMARKREYDEGSVDVAGALDYFQRKMAFTTGPVELSRAIDDRQVNVVDVRREQDYRAGHIPGSTNLPQDRLTPSNVSSPSARTCWCAARTSATWPRTLRSSSHTPDTL